MAYEFNDTSEAAGHADGPENPLTLAGTFVDEDGLAEVGRRRRRHPGGGVPAKRATGRPKASDRMMQHRINILIRSGNANARRALQQIVQATDRAYRAAKKGGLR